MGFVGRTKSRGAHLAADEKDLTPLLRALRTQEAPAIWSYWAIEKARELIAAPSTVCLMLAAGFVL